MSRDGYGQQTPSHKEQYGRHTWMTGARPHHHPFQDPRLQLKDWGNPSLSHNLHDFLHLLKGTWSRFIRTGNPEQQIP